MSIGKSIKLLSRFPPDGRVKAVMSLFAKQDAEHGAKGPLVAVEASEDVFFFGLFSALIADARAARSITAELVQTYTLCRTMGTGFRSRVVRSTWVARALNSKWAYAYGRAVGGVGYASRQGSKCLRETKALAVDLWGQMKKLKQPESLCFEGVQIGDLVIDSFLRIRPAATFAVDDPFVFTVIIQAVEDVISALRYFRERRPLLYVSSYTTYLEHGIPVRAAVASGVPVRVYGEITALGKELYADDMFHMASPGGFKGLFDALPDSRRQSALQEAERLLIRRFSGGRDPGNYYMRASAYARSKCVVPDVAGSIVIFLHDFFDSPHVWPDLIFTDFWQWICFSIESLIVGNEPVWVKPHPNRIWLNEQVLRQLGERYPQIRFIDSRVTNKQLVEAGMQCGVTAYGSVAHELAYWGIPTISCARHSHESFSFCRTAKSLSEYRHLLQTARVLPLNAAEMREQALAWYFMAHLHGDERELGLRAAVAQLRRLCDDSSTAAEELVAALCNVRSTDGWKFHIGRLCSEMSNRYVSDL